MSKINADRWPSARVVSGEEIESVGVHHVEIAGIPVRAVRAGITALIDPVPIAEKYHLTCDFDRFVWIATQYTRPDEPDAPTFVDTHTVLDWARAGLAEIDEAALPCTVVLPDLELMKAQLLDLHSQLELLDQWYPYGYGGYGETDERKLLPRERWADRAQWAEALEVPVEELILPPVDLPVDGTPLRAVRHRGFAMISLDRLTKELRLAPEDLTPFVQPETIFASFVGEIFIDQVTALRYMATGLDEARWVRFRAAIYDLPVALRFIGGYPDYQEGGELDEYGGLYVPLSVRVADDPEGRTEPDDDDTLADDLDAAAEAWNRRHGNGASV